MKMEMKIIINDRNDNLAMIISSCDEPELVSIDVGDDKDNIKVSIEDLRLALRKLSAK